MEPSTTGSIPSLADLTSDWLDLYTILDVAPDADADTIRRRISMRTSEAVGNSNHRDSKRREYYQALSQQILPQSRRVLLNPAFRDAYDQQRASHLAGSREALSYKAFLNTLSEDGSATAAAPSGDPAATSAAAAPEIVAAPVVPEVETFPVAPPTVAASIAPVTEPTPTAAKSAAIVADEEDEEDDTPLVPIIPKDRPLLTPIGDPASDKAASDKAAAAAKKKIPPKVAVSPASRVSSKPATLAPARPAAAPNEFVQTQKRMSYSYAPRVVVNENTSPRNSKDLFRPGERALSDTSIALLTAIVATMLSITIDLYTEPGSFALSATVLFLLPRLRIRMPK